MLSRVGLDFLPFYAAGTFVREGRPHAMYDIDAIRARERRIAREHGVPLGDGFGPFWNPPFYALPFAALAALPFPAAVLTWLGINLAALAVATGLMCRVLVRSGVGLPGVTPDWKTWGVVPLLIGASTPFLLALTHGQNTFCSLVLLTTAVLAWRSRRAVLAGVVIGLLAYKPQLAALVGLVALVDLGWRVAAGALLSGGAMLVAAAVAMPGILTAYLTALPRTLHFMQVQQVYMWERHVTLKAFWRLLIQGYATGEANLVVTALTAASAGAILVALLVAARWRKGGTGARDALIAATVASMPLVMPFYFDYDLLLLALPAVLYSVGRSRGSAARRPGVAQGSRGMLDRSVVPAWCALYLWMIVNAELAERTRVNVAVPLLAVVAAGLLARALRRDAETAQCTAAERDADASPTASPPPPHVRAAA